MNSDVLWAWAAGIVDGEGCIRLAFRSNKGRPSYSVMITVAMSHEATINKLREIWQRGSKYEYKGTNKPMYQTQVNGEHAVEVARKLLPHLFTKSRQAELIIEFWENVNIKEGEIRSSPLKWLFCEQSSMTNSRN